VIISIVVNVTHQYFYNKNNLLVDVFFVCRNPIRFFAVDATYHSQMSRICVTTFHALYGTVIVNRPVVSKLIIMQLPCNAILMDPLLSVELRDVVIYMSTALPEVLNFPEVW